MNILTINNGFKVFSIKKIINLSKVNEVNKMELPKNIQHQIAQFQQAQQQAQAITMQKQSVEMQIKETEKALEELKKVEGDTDVYKTAGNLLIKVNKDEVTEELEDKIETLKLREKTVKRQEERIMAKLQEMQGTLQEAMQGSGAQQGLGN